MSKSDSSRIQSSQAGALPDPSPNLNKPGILTVHATTPKAQGGKNMSSGGFASRGQSAADRNTQGSSSNSNANSRSGNSQQSKSGPRAGLQGSRCVQRGICFFGSRCT